MVVHDDDEYQVGYQKPPLHTRFKLGQSGNPRGRPKATPFSEHEDPVIATLPEKMEVTVGGKRVKMPAYELLLRALLKKGAEGNIKSIQMFMAVTDNFKTVIERDQREMTQAGRDYLEAVYKAAEQYTR